MYKQTNDNYVSVALIVCVNKVLMQLSHYLANMDDDS